jgi:hypothetical protein
MTGDFSDELPLALREMRTCPLFVMRLNVRPLQIVGETPGVYRRVGVVPGKSPVMRYPFIRSGYTITANSPDRPLLSR